MHDTLKAIEMELCITKHLNNDDLQRFQEVEYKETTSLDRSLTNILHWSKNIVSQDGN